jgi:hypothetical protein
MGRRLTFCAEREFACAISVFNATMAQPKGEIFYSFGSNKTKGYKQDSQTFHMEQIIQVYLIKATYMNKG